MNDKKSFLFFIIHIILSCISLFLSSGLVDWHTLNFEQTMNVETIKTRSEYEKAFQRLSELLDKNPCPGSEDDKVLELLLLAIKDYEEKTIEPICSDPIAAIKFRMEQMQSS